MSYTPTIAATKAALVTVLRAALDVQVDYVWTPDAESDAVFVTRPLLDDDDASTVPVSLRLPVMQPGAQPVEETYTIDLTIWSWRGDLSPHGAQEAEELVDSISGQIIEALANNGNLGIPNVLFQMVGDGGSQTLRPYGTGWALMRSLPLDVTARLST